MRLSREKCVHLSHVLLKSLQETPEVELLEKPNDVRLRILRSVEWYIKEDEAVERLVRAKIESMRRGVVEGTDEWDVLFRKFYLEETGKKRKVRG